MNGEHCLLALAIVYLCLSASSQVVVNNAHCRNLPGDEQLCIIHSDVDGQFF